MISFLENGSTPPLSTLSDDDLLKYSVSIVRHENEIGLHIISCLREAEKRMLYFQVRMTSLWEYATQYLGLSNGNAQMKIDAMRLARDNPIAQEKIQSGELSIFNAAKLNSFFRNERKLGKSYNEQEKVDVIKKVLGLSQSKCERILLALSPEAIPPERIRPLTETKTELRLVLDESTMIILKRLKELLSHKMPDVTYGELLDYLAREKVEALERKLMGATLTELEDQSAQVTPTGGAELAGGMAQNSFDLSKSRPLSEGPVTPTRRVYIPLRDRRWTMGRAKGQCEHIFENGDRCKSRWKIEIDHIIALHLGGKNERSNYRAVCRGHNLYYAKHNIGPLMNQYVASLN